MVNLILLSYAYIIQYTRTRVNRSCTQSNLNPLPQSNGVDYTFGTFSYLMTNFHTKKHIKSVANINLLLFVRLTELVYDLLPDYRNLHSGISSALLKHGCPEDYFAELFHRDFDGKFIPLEVNYH